MYNQPSGTLFLHNGEKTRVNLRASVLQLWAIWLEVLAVHGAVEPGVGLGFGGLGMIERLVA